MSFLLRCYCLIRFVLVTSELITLIKDNDIKCVYSAFYLGNGSHYRNINRTFPETLNWLESDWIKSDYTENFLPVTDERWTDFRFTTSLNVSNNPTVVSVCMNKTSSIKISDKNQQNKVNWPYAKPDVNKIPIESIYSWYWRKIYNGLMFLGSKPNDLLSKSTNSNDQDGCECKIIKIANRTLSVYSAKSYTYNTTLKFDPYWISGATFKSIYYNYYYSNVTSAYKSSINISSSSCVTMYVSVDKGCYLNITLESHNTIPNSQTIDGFNENNALKEWRRVEIKSNIKEDKNINFYRETYHNTKAGFWAIDEIKNCSSNIGKYPAVKNPPKLVSIKHNRMTIAINLEYGSDELPPQYYVIQYRKDTSSEGFKNFGSKNQYISNKTVNVVMNLSTTETYEIRVILIHHDNKSIQDDVPTLIVNKKSLRATKSNNTLVELTWEQPKQKNFNHYEIKYKFRRNFCFTNYPDENETTNDTKITINFGNKSVGLIQLYGINSGAKTLIDEIDLLPFDSKDILEKEFPKTVNLSTHQINFEKCEEFSGPVNYSIAYKCLSNWCKYEALKTYEFNNYRHSIDLEVDLLPYTLYSISVIARRAGQLEKSKEYPNQRTPPREPHPVEKLSVYRKNNDTVWLRWKEHYPPNGQTEMYNATVQNKSVILVYNTTVFNCTLWKGYVCAVVNYSKTHSDGNFISISSKNYHVEKHSPGIDISIIEESRSSVVENVNVLSSGSPHEIILVWEYPLYTYGEQLKQFLISVNQRHISRNITEDRTNYNETIGMEFGKKFNISIWAENKFQGEKTNISIHISNPVAKFSPNPFVLWCSTSCHLILPEKHEETNFTITYTGSKKEKQLGPRNICTNKNSTCTFGIDKNDIKTLKFFVNFAHDNNIIPIEFPTEQPIEKKSNVATITVLAVFVLTLFILFILVVHYMCKRKISSCVSKQQNFNENTSSDNSEENELLSNYEERDTFIKIKNFKKYLSSPFLETDLKEKISQQFKGIPTTSKQNYNDGKLEKNSESNRYMNVLPYNKTRVILKNNSEKDYINANYINGYKTPKAFIATQDPLESTLHDFWYMIFQENVEIIVMLTNFEEGEEEEEKEDTDMVAKYWPDHGSYFRFGKFLIVSSKITQNYNQQKLLMYYRDQTRQVYHFQYSNWPDGKVPPDVQDFTMFMKEISDFPHHHPVVVHSRTGCGRTGTFILCDIVLCMAKEEEQVDFVSVLKELREQRTEMVENEEQYIFAHFVIAEYFFGLTSRTMSEILS